ncbi:hypothetical protein BgiBS90_012980 [Biomphalaria glabrata]|nr:hypothetical protein BgiBS90_012980 [Biomphalaria glabrata]
MLVNDEFTHRLMKINFFPLAEEIASSAASYLPDFCYGMSEIITPETRVLLYCPGVDCPSDLLPSCDECDTYMSGTLSLTWLITSDVVRIPRFPPLLDNLGLCPERLFAFYPVSSSGILTQEVSKIVEESGVAMRGPLLYSEYWCRNARTAVF